MKGEKRSLLERYGIPVNHLDFGYINECTNVRELEKIVAILRSNEEGYFPDLTKCAEDKLRELCPNSPSFRLEERIQSSRLLPAEQLKPIMDMTKELKKKDSALASLPKDEKAKKELLENIPIRKCATIGKAEDETKDEVEKRIPNTNASGGKKMQATDYRKWDKYDADAEVLKLELEEERRKEELQIKTRVNEKKYHSKPKIEEVTSEEKSPLEVAKKLADFEKEKLSENYRMRGNDYFRGKDFELAVAEYTRAIQVFPSGAAIPYCNRAAAYMKLDKYIEAIEDCNECLSLEPQNLKALIRLAEASNKYGRKREAQGTYQKVLAIDSTNNIALKALEKLDKELGELPPSNATRMQIQECKTENIQEKAKPENPATTIEKPKKIERMYDLAELVKPNKLSNPLPTPTNIPEGPSKQQPKKLAGGQYDLADLVKPSKIKSSANIPKVAPANDLIGDSIANKSNGDNLLGLQMPAKPKNPMNKSLIQEM